jgi:23S rRNA pseudouridine1911/1915/1917 synthase
MTPTPDPGRAPEEPTDQQPPLIRPGGKVDPDVLRTLAEESAEGEDAEGLQRVEFTLSRDLNKRLDKYLTDRITFMSRTQLQGLIDVGGVTVNGRTPKASTRLRLGDTVVVVVPPPPAKTIQGEDIPLDIIHEDEHLIVLNKSPDIIVHPARSHNKGTLLNALVHHFQTTGVGGLSTVGDELARPGVVHRLDRRTSGVMVVAKDDEAHWRLGRQFELRKTDKRYLALVEGVIESDADVIDAPIGAFPSRVKGLREKMSIRHDHLGKPAVTICRVRQRFDHFTLVELELKTGRTHQIRVHLSFLGYPIVGDDMYGGHVLKRGHVVRDAASLAAGESMDDVIIDRQALHAALLGFRHPHTGQHVEFSAPLRGDMAEAVCLLRAHANPSPELDLPGATVDLSAL